MPIAIFENRQTKTITFRVDPSGKTCEVPHLARVGVRHASKLPCHTSIDEDRVDYWCDDQNCELDLQYASTFDKLSWEICVGGGWCGSLIDGQPTWVEDLLPTSGQITAEKFAELVMQADGWPDSEKFYNRQGVWLESKFIEYFGTEPVDVSHLSRNLSNPFE